MPSVEDLLAMVQQRTQGNFEAQQPNPVAQFLSQVADVLDRAKQDQQQQQDVDANRTLRALQTRQLEQSQQVDPGLGRLLASEAQTAGVGSLPRPEGTAGPLMASGGFVQPEIAPPTTPQGVDLLRSMIDQKVRAQQATAQTAQQAYQFGVQTELKKQEMTQDRLHRIAQDARSAAITALQTSKDRQMYFAKMKQDIVERQKLALKARGDIIPASEQASWQAEQQAIEQRVTSEWTAVLGGVPLGAAQIPSPNAPGTPGQQQLSAEGQQWIDAIRSSRSVNELIGLSFPTLSPYDEDLLGAAVRQQLAWLSGGGATEAPQTTLGMGQRMVGGQPGRGLQTDGPFQLTPPTMSR